MLKRVISITLCIAVLIIASPTNKVNAVGAVVVPIGVIIGGIMAGLGITSVNDLSMDDFNNFSLTEKNVFMDKFYKSLSSGVQKEITEKAKLVKPGEIFSFQMSTIAIKEIFFQIYNNVSVSDPESNFIDSRDFNFNESYFATSMSGDFHKKEVAYKGEKYETKVAYFPQLDGLVSMYDFLLPWMWDEVGVYHSRTGFFLRTGILSPNEYAPFESQGFNIVESFSLGQIKPLKTNYTSELNCQIESMVRNNNVSDVTIGTFTNSNGKEVRLSYSSSLYVENEGEFFYDFDVFLDGEYLWGNSGICISGRGCTTHGGVSHAEYMIFSLFKNENGQSFFTLEPGSLKHEVSCSQAVYSPSDLRSLDIYGNFSPSLIKNFAFKVTTDEPIGIIDEKVKSLDDDENILVNIPITGDGSVALPTDKTDIMDMTDATTGGGTDVVDPPDTDIEIPDLDIPNIFKKFPFSIPYDIYAIFSVLNAPPITPKWDIPILGVVISFDLSQFNGIAKIARWTFYFLFVFGLIKITRKLIKG